MNSGSQIWSMEKLENKLIDMREMYQEFKDRILSQMVSIRFKLNYFDVCEITSIFEKIMMF